MLGDPAANAWARGVSHWIRGRRRAADREVEAALADYDAMLALQPDFAVGRHERSVIRAQAGDPEGALADLDRAVDLGYTGRPGETSLLRAVLRMETGDLAGAAADYERVLERLAPENPSRAAIEARLAECRAAAE